MFLKANEFVPYAPIETGKQIKMNHAGCPAGLDTKERLYIRRKDSATIVAYCQHCGSKGVYRTGVRNLRELQRANREIIKSGAIALPKDYTGDLNKMPAKGKAWLYKYRMTDNLIKTYYIGYSEMLDRVILPVYNSSGKLIYWQGRSLDVLKNPPKYLNKAASRESMMFYAAQRSGGMVIVCEDILSAIRAHTATVLPAVALLGTSVDDGIVRSLVENFDRAYVFLDPDARGKSRDLARRLDTLMADGAMSIVAEKQPKELSDIELVDLII